MIELSVAQKGRIIAEEKSLASKEHSVPNEQASSLDFIPSDEGTGILSEEIREKNVVAKTAIASGMPQKFKDEVCIKIIFYSAIKL